MASPAPTPPPPHRRPLQPKNSNTTHPTPPVIFPKPKPIPIAAGAPGDADKENRMAFPMTPSHFFEEKVVETLREASLGEELEAVRRRRDRLRMERERTELELKERDLAMERWAKEMEARWDEQRNLELELRLLIKLKDLRSNCMGLCAVQSLREREQEKNNFEAQGSIFGVGNIFEVAGPSSSSSCEKEIEAS